MKLTEIKKIAEAERISMQDEEMNFFRNLYKHCMAALETVPEEFIRSAFEQARSEKAQVTMIYFSESGKSRNTHVSFAYVNEEEDYNDEEAYLVKSPKFDFRHFFMEINLVDKTLENAVQFSWDTCSTQFSHQDAERIFGKYLIAFDETNDTCSVSTNCFD